MRLAVKIEACYFVDQWNIVDVGQQEQGRRACQTAELHVKRHSILDGDRPHRLRRCVPVPMQPPHHDRNHASQVQLCGIPAACVLKVHADQQGVLPSAFYS